MMEGKPDPPYPAGLSAIGEAGPRPGVGGAAATISREGAIEDLQVLSGHPMLAKAAVEAVRQWRYRPYEHNGEPVEVETEVNVNFVLSGG
jgi:periplasmic protein TonB